VRGAPHAAPRLRRRPGRAQPECGRTDRDHLSPVRALRLRPARLPGGPSPARHRRKCPGKLVLQPGAGAGRFGIESPARWPRLGRRAQPEEVRMSEPEIGATASAATTVKPSDLASAFRLAPEDEFPPVYATARMVALMELAAARLLAPHL